MFLKKIEIHGFKSFANKTELQFDQNLTTIVGPNGSGKSNIADAIRWATGEQSQKLLRTKKAEEVIFAGSDHKNRLGMAEVNLYIDNSQGKIPIDFKEVVITRRVYRTGESEYIINKSKVRLADIQLLLARANFGQHNYSIIGQGMIDSILTQSSESRKGFFDEATGVKVYQIKKEKAQHKYSNTQNNLQQSKAIIKEIFPRLKYLTRQVNKLAKRQEIKKHLIKLQNDYYGFLISEINQKIKHTEEKMKGKNKHKTDLEEQMKKIQDKLYAEENKNSYADEFNKIQTEYNDLINQKNKLTHDKIVYQGKLDLEFSGSGNNINWITNQKNELEEEYHNNQKELKKLKEKLINIQQDLNTKTEKQDEFLKKIKNIQEELESQIKSAGPELESDNLKLKIKKLNSIIKKLIENIDKIEKKELKKEIYFIGKEIEYLDKEINKEQNDNNYQELQNKFQKYLITKDSYVNEIYELKNKKNLLENKIENIEKKQINLESKLEKLKLEIKMSTSTDKSETEKEINKMIDSLNEKIKDTDQKISSVQEKIDDLDKKNKEERRGLFQMQRESQKIQNDLNQINSEIQDINIELAKEQTHHEDLEREIEYEELKKENLNLQIENLEKNEIFNKINKFKRQLSQIGGIEDDIEDEHQEVKNKFEFLEKQIEDLEKASKNLKEMIDDLNEKIEEKFYSNFKKINETFNKYFQILFNGGHANLTIKKESIKKKELTDSENIENEAEKEIETETEAEINKTYEGRAEKISDIIISVKLPGKKQANMTYLSGGEKALTSIALICSIIYNNPSPFVVLDEVDAALDEANSEKFAEIIENLKNKTQFICISHNRATMYRADTLYGVTMDNESVSKLLSLNFKEAQKYTD